MRKKNVLLAFVSALLLLAMFGTRITIPVSASTIDVHPGESIQAAINSAQPGDTIFVHAGTYYGHVKVNKTLTLVGENRVTTIVDGEGTGTVIKVTADNANITGFTIQNGGNLPYSGLFVGNCNGSTINNNTIRNSAYGIELLNSNSSSIIGNMIMNNSWAGIYIHDSNENIIYDNTVANNSIGAWIPSSAIPNTFYHNNFINNINQASDFGPSNWDNGTGNFWSDYTGVDGDGNGIGDTSHEMDPGTDYYPLMSPWGDAEFPVADAGPDQTIFQGMTVTFNGSRSYDDVGIKSYIWTFTDVTLKTLTGVHPTYRFKNVGNFNVTLNVTDYSSRWDIDTMWVNISADDTEPIISNLSQEPTLPGPGENVTISVDVTDEQSGVRNVTISYRTNSGSWTNVSMSRLTGDAWEGKNPGFPDGTEVQYKIIAYDNAENPAVDDNEGEYYIYTVIPEFPVAIFLLLFIILTLVTVRAHSKKEQERNAPVIAHLKPKAIFHPSTPLS